MLGYVHKTAFVTFKLYLYVTYMVFTMFISKDRFNF